MFQPQGSSSDIIIKADRISLLLPVKQILFVKQAQEKQPVHTHIVTSQASMCSILYNFIVFIKERR